MRGARGGSRRRTASHRWHPWILTPRVRGEGRTESGGWWGDRYQTISADHHNIGGSTAAWLEERRDLASGMIVSPINGINGTDNLPAAKGPDVVGARANRSAYHQLPSLEPLTQ